MRKLSPCKIQFVFETPQAMLQLGEKAATENRVAVCISFVQILDVTSSNTIR